jgi:predicted ATPase
MTPVSVFVGRGSSGKSFKILSARAFLNEENSVDDYNVANQAFEALTFKKPSIPDKQ